jgi:hypothetical protein
VVALIVSLLTTGFASCGSAAAADSSTAALLAETLPGIDPDAVTLLTEQVADAGYNVTAIDVAALTNNAAFSALKYDLLVLPNGRVLPAEAAPAILDHLKGGGDLLVVGLPMWDTPTFRIGGRWISRADYDRGLAAQRPARVLEDFEGVTLPDWRRSSDNPAHPVRHELAPAGPGAGRALRVVIENHTGWETFSSPPLTNPFPSGHSLTCFRAKGGPRTRQLMLEWSEQDGSRWIAAVDLTTNWSHYALAPDAFKAWTPPRGRGGPGDRLNVTNASRFVVGIAYSHTAVDGPTHEYWVDDLGTAPNPFGGSAPPVQFNPPRLESLCPGYQFYPVTPPVEVRTGHERETLEFWGNPEASIAGPTLATNSQLLAMHPRPRGIGFRQDRPWRWEPLLGAYDPRDGDYRGALAALVVNVKAPFNGSVWAGFTASEPEFFRRPAVTHALRQVLRRMREGLFLVEAGSDLLAVPHGDSASGKASGPVRAGARVVNLGRETRSNLTINVELGSTVTPGWQRLLRETVAIRSGQVLAFESPLRFPSGDLVRADLAFESRPLRFLDALVQPLGGPHPAAAFRPPPFVQVRDGGFWLDGKPWKPHGVNYLPSSGIGVNNAYFEHWLGRGAYDPSVIQRDLERIKKAGLNAVSAFIYFRSLDAGHLFDFLRRCEALDLKVNLSLRPGTPMEFRWNEMKALIEHYQLASNSTVFAYDLAWEPSHYDQAYQENRYSQAWSAWVAARHGSMGAAVTNWGVKARPAGADARWPIGDAILVPTMDQLTRDGPWRRMVADYRLFLDDLVGPKYAEARRLVRSIDAHHPVSFRMQFSGDPTHNPTGLLPYDLYGLRDAVDIWEPEAYGRIGDWDRVKAGQFTAAYARLCNPALPVMWAEMGCSVWDNTTMAPQPEKLAFAARYYADFYRMLIESGADGVFFWWYPGGYRLNEQSDYGILNPDGTDREITRIIRTKGREFLAAPKPPPPDQWIAVDRDRDARGLVGIYEAAKDAYWRATAANRRPGLKWETRPGDRTRAQP